MKTVISREILAQTHSKQFMARYDTLTAQKQMLKNTLQLNKQVDECDIHELFAFYDQAFFHGKLDGKVLLEWSTRMTMCAGICYCQSLNSQG